MLSMAQKAHYVSSGEYMCEQTVKSGGAYLVIVASDASDRTKKHFSDMCSYYEVPFRIYSDKDNLGHNIGKEFRASLCITNEGMAEQIISKIDGGI